MGPTETRSVGGGSVGCMSIASPPGVTGVKRLRLAGEYNRGKMYVQLYRCGWDPTRMCHEKTPLLRTPLEFAPSGPFVYTWPPLNSPEPLEVGGRLDSQYQALTLFIEATDVTSISLVAVEFGFELEG